MICFNPERAERDAALREVMTGKLTAMINGTNTLSATKRAELRGRISTMPGLNPDHGPGRTTLVRRALTPTR